jgi:hypothetical protein
MLDAVLAIVAFTLWVSPYVLYFAHDVYVWWRLRPYRRAMTEYERLQAVRSYATWVRNMPPPPPRGPRGPLTVPTPVRPPVQGAVRPYPGRRFLGD